MSQIVRALVCVVGCAVTNGLYPGTIWAVSPNPLQSAYWKFDEGLAGSRVPATGHDPVLDEIGANHFDVYDAGVAPTYTTTVAPTPLKSGAENHFALSFTPNNDLITLWSDDNLHRGGLGKSINNGILPADGGFTIEAAFMPTALNRTQAIVAKEGVPDEGTGLATLELKIGADNYLQFAQYDGSGILRAVTSLEPMNLGQWYYAAVVNTGTDLSLYLDSNDGNGYQLQGTPEAVDKPLYQGPHGYTEPTDEVKDPDSWSNSWTVGRGQLNGQPDHFFKGLIDEVRLWNSPLSPANFLFGIDGDYNNDGKVDAGDYVMWRKGGTLRNEVDAPGTVDSADYDVWRARFGNPSVSSASFVEAAPIPEPSSYTLLLSAMPIFLAGGRFFGLDIRKIALTLGRICVLTVG